MERPYAKGRQLNITGMMGKILICYRVAEEGHSGPQAKSAIQTTVWGERLNHLGGMVCPTVPVNR